MYVGIGLLFGCLLAIAIVPLVHNRAVRLTVSQLERRLPQSIAEIQVDKDLLRAEFAMSARRNTHRTGIVPVIDIAIKSPRRRNHLR
jgi:hypothetical protein